MFDRKRIMQTLRELDFDRECYWVAAGAAMVLHGVKEQTGDIDLGCNKAMADRLQETGCRVTALQDGKRKIQLSGDIEIFEDWIEGEIETIDAIPVVSLDGIIRMKARLGREKDMRDIELIKNRLAGQA